MRSGGADHNEANRITDAQLIDGFRNRDQSVLARVDSVYGSYLLTVCMNVLGSREDSEECLNDAYMRAWNRIPPDSPDNLKAYLTKLARTAAIDRYRHDRRVKRGGSAQFEPFEELEGIVADGVNVTDEVETAELAAALNRFLSQSTQREQICFVRRFYFYETVAQIAARTGIPKSTVHDVLKGMCAKLRAALTGEGFL